ncbi:MAG: right-handed parallel beta-helix repeat-containing protein [Armatimonadota bacterium]
MDLKSTLAVLVLFAAWISSADATTYFVSPTGVDTNPGTLSRPFRTISRAAAVMRPGDTCYVRTGVYRETVRPARSGERGRPIRFAAYRNEPVVVTGADPIRGWMLDSGQTYRASAQWGFNQLFVDGRMMVCARWPNTGLDPMRQTWAEAGQGTTANRIVDPKLPSADLTGALAHILPGAHWVTWTRPVRQYDPAARSFGFQGNWSQDWAHAVQQGTLYFLENHRALLDAPGEWYLDADARTVYLIPPQGGNPNNHRVEAKRRELAFDLAGRSYVYVDRFRIFAASISMDGSAYCRVTGCHLRYASHFTACEGWGTPQHRNSGVVISGHDNELSNSSVVYSAGNGVTLLGANNRVVNCLIRNVNYAAVDCGAIWAEGTGNVIRSNTLCDTGRSVIVHRTMKAGRIEYNNMYNAGLLTTDLGMTYCFQTDGQGTMIAYNWVHHNMARSVGVGIYIDNGSSNHIIHHNVCWSNPDSGIRLNTPSHNNLVYHNTVIQNGNSLGYWGPNDNKDQAGCQVVNNIFTDQVSVGTSIDMHHNFQGKDPKLVDPAALNFRLRPDSPCRGAGVRIEGITAAPFGPSADLGAYEAGMPYWRPGHTWGNPPVF